MGVDAPGATTRALHLRPGAIGLVFVGGTLGTLVRYELGLLLAPWQTIPVAILAANITGAFALAWLLDALLRAGPDHGARRAWRLFAGTGLLGGFTTYSALAVDTDGLITAQPWVGVGYGLVTVILGAVATAAGIATSRTLSRRQEPQP